MFFSFTQFYMNNSTNHTANKYSLTTPLYYVNGLPHIGSAYTTMVADAISRFQRLQGKSVLFVTGTDEHGQKIQRTAEEKNISPQVHCDEIVASFKSLWKKLNIQYDRFSRTTAPQHEAIVQEFFQRVWDKGDIYLDRQQGWYCVGCEEFKEERELLENKSCPLHPNKIAEWRDEQNYFFRLSKYQANLVQYYQENPQFIQPETRKNEVINFVEQGLKDFSISRLNVNWGFPVPTDPKHTIYVWFDALLGYVTALLEADQEPTLANATAKWFPFNLHLIGKDILRFHAIYWPAMLMSAELPLPEKIFAHGFLTKDGQKMSKSVGNTLDPFELVERYNVDGIRYYFLKEIELGKDGDFNENRFINVLNADLANDLGNLLNRSLGMLKKYCNSNTPQIIGADLSQEYTLQKIGEKLGKSVTNKYNNLQLSQACEEIFTLIRASNKFIDESAPWSLFKQGKQKQVEEILYSVLESIRLSAYLLSPIVPNLSSDIYQQLGFDIDFNNQALVREKADFSSHSSWGKLYGHKNLNKAKPIFARIELTTAE